MTSKSHSNLQLADYIDKNKKNIDRQLKSMLLDMLPNHLITKNYKESLDYSLIAGGKRLRPILTIATFELFDVEDHEITKAACVTEMVHTGSLMLDDLPCMDNSDLRRGHKTSHKVYGESLTILSSAALWVESFRILSELQTPNRNDLIRSATNCIGGKGLIQGQLLDLAAFNRVQTAKELRKCYELKTGVMFDLAVTIGAVLGKANKQELQILRDFARHFGVAFQIRDDIIDIVQASEQSGKDHNTDEKNNKPNFVSLLGIDGAKIELAKTIKLALQKLELLDRDTSRLKSFTEALQTV